jgi:hypothetical protein
MFNLVLMFLGIGGFIVAALFYLSAVRPVATADSTTTYNKKPTWDEKATWPEIKALWMEWYERCQEMEAPKQKALCSWGRTMALCAGLCLVGILLEVQYNQLISIDNILAGFRRSPPVAASYQRSPSHLHQNTAPKGMDR